MYDLKWFKFDLWTFDRAEFKYIESCEGGPMFLYYWVRLLSEAAKLNDGGRVYVFKNSKIDFSELAILLRSDEETMTRAIFLYDSLGLITYNAEAGLVIKNWSSYIGDNARADSDGARESEYADGEEESLLYSAERAPEKSREEIARERNREAQRKWRERQREKRSAEKNGSNKEEKLGDNSVTQSDNKHNAESNDSTVLRNESRNESVILRNAESNITDNESNNYGNGNSPKNIFIEENREEENRRNKNRGEENREKTINNNSLSPSLCESARSVSEEDFDKCPDCGNGSESDHVRENNSDCVRDNNSNYVRSNNPYCGNLEGADGSYISPAPSRNERGERLSAFGSFKNVYMSDRELKELNGRLGVGKVSRLIDDLSEHMASTGKTYLSHYATLLRWSKNEYAPRDSDLSLGWSEARSAEAHSVRELSPQVTEGECDSQSGSLGNGYEVRTARGLFPPSKTVPLSPGERKVGECEKSPYPLGNGYARRYDAWDSFNSRSGDYANKKGPRDKPREPKSRYGDFDPEEAMRLAIERTRIEFEAEHSLNASLP